MGVILQVHLVCVPCLCAMLPSFYKTKQKNKNNKTTKQQNNKTTKQQNNKTTKQKQKKERGLFSLTKSDTKKANTKTLYKATTKVTLSVRFWVNWVNWMVGGARCIVNRHGGRRTRTRQEEKRWLINRRSLSLLTSWRERGNCTPFGSIVG